MRSFQSWAGAAVGSARHAAGERIEPRRLVEVAVDDERPRLTRRRAGGRRAAGAVRGVVVARRVSSTTDADVRRTAGASASGQRQEQPAALVDALEAGLRVRDGLDRRPPSVGRLATRVVSTATPT